MVMQEASDALSRGAQSTWHNSGHSISSHKCDGQSYVLLKASSFLLVTNCTEETW